MGKYNLQSLKYVVSMQNYVFTFWKKREAAGMPLYLNLPSQFACVVL